MTGIPIPECLTAFFWAADYTGCGWYRMQLPAAALAALGHRATSSRVMPDETRDGTGVIVGQRVANPGPSARWQALAAAGRPLVYDIDDHYFEVPATSGAHSFFQDPALRDRMLANIAVATRVTCATAALAEWASKYNRDVVVVPNGLPAAILDWPRPGGGERVTIGWGGSSDTVVDFAASFMQYERFLRRNPQVRLHTIGHPMPRATHDADPFVPGSLEFLRAVDFDVSLAPYRDIPFNQAKVPTKALEAAFLGIPVVASAIRPYRQFVTHGVTGLLVRAEHEWDRMLRALVHDEALRTELGDNARRQARGHTIEQLAFAWEQALTL